ncbi:MAG: hypothetical protein JRN15_10330 [Nitrososphaerota archaeon]|nr:hypothetical protein [Nitrososphaerota archaeon]
MSDEVVINADLKATLTRLLAGGPESRECVYRLHEDNGHGRKLLSGEHGIQYFLQIIEIAKTTGAPVDEVRDRFVPLLDQDLYDTHCKNLIKNSMKSGGLASALDKIAKQKKAEVQELARRHEEAMAFIEKEKARLQQNRVRRFLRWLFLPP